MKAVELRVRVPQGRNTQRFTRRKNGNEFHTVSIGTDSRSCTIRGAMVSSVTPECVNGCVGKFKVPE